MKKVLLFFTAAAVLAACSKTEVIPEQNVADQEITFETSPITKALADNQKDFVNTNVFATYAFYHTDDWVYSTYANNVYTPDYSFYIGGTLNQTTGAREGVTIKWNGTVWKDPNKSYYWPKNGKLTFFSWSLNKADLTFPEATTWLTCTPDQGIVVKNYDVKTNKNIEFMVADIASDKTANENQYSHTGVPTLFRHKLSQFQATVCEAEAYKGIKFTLKSITFPNLAYLANYTQNPDAMAAGTAATEQTYYTSETGQVVNTTTAAAVTGVDQYIYLPQSLANKTIVIVYDVAYDTNGDGTPEVTETVTATKKLSEIFGDNWKMGNKYILNIKFSVDEILWDPAVEEWATGSGSVTIK
jgi:hypothetical protein